MFGGVGGEFLWSPFMKRWALGLNLNWVKQRDFTRTSVFKIIRRLLAICYVLRLPVRF